MPSSPLKEHFKSQIAVVYIVYKSHSLKILPIESSEISTLDHKIDKCMSHVSYQEMDI